MLIFRFQISKNKREVVLPFFHMHCLFVDFESSKMILFNPKNAIVYRYICTTVKYTHPTAQNVINRALYF